MNPNNSASVSIVAAGEKSVSVSAGFQVLRFSSCAEAISDRERLGKQSAIFIDWSKSDDAQVPATLSAARELRVPVVFLDVSSEGGLTVNEPGALAASCLPQFGNAEESIDAIRDRLSPQRSLSVLSPRELEVLQLLVSGLANKQVASRLFLSVRTVEKHRANIHRKLETRSLAALTRIWMHEVESAA